MVFNYLKKQYPSLYVIITGIAIIFWFKGMYGILDHFIPNTLQWSVGLVVIGILILYLNDFSLNELHEIKVVAPAVAGAHYQGKY